MSDLSSPDDAMLAGEYVLGLLDRRERDTVQARIPRDPIFAVEVAVWEAWLTPLAETVAPVPPRPEVWDAIVRKLEARRGADVRAWWNSLALWRGVAAATTALAAACLALVVTRPEPVARAPAPTLTGAVMAVAQLHVPEGAPADGSPVVFVVTLDAASDRLIIAPTGHDLPDGRSAELWLMPAGGTPVSLGLLDEARPVTLSVPDAVRSGATLGVSMEPEGGSPTGLPTGAVMAQGDLEQL